MSWATFLTQIASAKEVTFVGPLYLEKHTPHTPTVYVDGGSRFRMTGSSLKEFPTVSVGDGDSAGGGWLDEVLPSVKDYSDLAFALRGLPASVSHLTLLGFLGGRRDHELGNFGEINRFLSERSQFTQVKMVGNRGDHVVAFANGRHELELRGTFSVFVLSSATVTIKGACRYPLEPGVSLTPLGSHTLSNEGMGMVSIESNSPCFVMWE